VRSVSTIIVLFLTLTTAKAAGIEVKHIENGSVLVVMDGDLEFGDIEKFRTKTEALATAGATVKFRSNGGNLLAGIRIGSLIRTKKFATVVSEGTQCASACAIAWLGGIPRFVEEYASVGFHSAYIVKAAGPIESGPGNAILGAYLNQLGLSEKAILYITHAGPTSIQWLKMEEAAEYGIVVERLRTSYSASRSGSDGSAVTERRMENPEGLAIDFVLSVFARWSGANADVLPYLDGLYTDNVHYNGKLVPRQMVLLDKQRFANQWTQRTYNIRPGSLSATCVTAGETCRVKGVINWKFSEAKAKYSSRGVSRFEYSVVLNGERPQIAVESSSVNEGPTAAPSSLEKVGRGLKHLLGRISMSLPIKTSMKTVPKPKATLSN
jgi:hypothetical protein